MSDQAYVVLPGTREAMMRLRTTIDELGHLLKRWRAEGALATDAIRESYVRELEQIDAEATAAADAVTQAIKGVLAPDAAVELRGLARHAQSQQDEFVAGWGRIIRALGAVRAEITADRLVVLLVGWDGSRVLLSAAKAIDEAV